MHLFVQTLYMATALALVTAGSVGLGTGCSIFGNSCLGGHGKRSLDTNAYLSSPESGIETAQLTDVPSSYLPDYKRTYQPLIQRFTGYVQESSPFLGATPSIPEWAENSRYLHQDYYSD